MFEKECFGSFDIYQPFENDQWILDFKNGKQAHGTFKEICSYLIKKGYTKIDELEFAVSVMIENNHNAAHFGVMGTCIFTFTKQISLDNTG